MSVPDMAQYICSSRIPGVSSGHFVAEALHDRPRRNQRQPHSCAPEEEVKGSPDGLAVAGHTRYPRAAEAEQGSRGEEARNSVKFAHVTSSSQAQQRTGNDGEEIERTSTHQPGRTTCSVSTVHLIEKTGTPQALSVLATPGQARRHTSLARELHTPPGSTWQFSSMSVPGIGQGQHA
eukprot:317309-Rhodomonas_salina.1